MLVSVVVRASAAVALCTVWLSRSLLLEVVSIASTQLVLVLALAVSVEREKAEKAIMWDYPDDMSPDDYAPKTFTPGETLKIVYAGLICIGALLVVQAMRGQA